MVDPMRRRLTVGLSDPPVAARRASVNPPNAEEFGLAAIFEQARKEKRKAIASISVAHEEKSPSSFDQKDHVYLFHPEVGEAEGRELQEWLRGQARWTCNKGLKDVPNQDCMSILMVEDDFALYGVYDGHGPHGHVVSEFACKILPKLFLQFMQKQGRETDVKNVIMESFKVTQENIAQENIGRTIDAEMSGTTCTVAYHCFKQNKLWVGHVGDSRAIIGSVDGAHCWPLTIDHKPELDGEKARIEAAGGRVIFDGYFNHRVFVSNGMYPGLNMSRALGDLVGHRQAGLSATPDVIELDLGRVTVDPTTPDGMTDDKLMEGDKVLLLCTDGVWEFLANAQALGIAIGTEGTGMEELAKRSYEEWMKDSDNQIADDITGIMVVLRGEAGGGKAPVYTAASAEPPPKAQ